MHARKDALVQQRVRQRENVFGLHCAAVAQANHQPPQQLLNRNAQSHAYLRTPTNKQHKIGCKNWVQGSRICCTHALAGGFGEGCERNLADVSDGAVPAHWVKLKLNFGFRVRGRATGNLLADELQHITRL